MATTDKNTIYSWFQTDDFPTEDQFRATWDSFWHKSESIPMSSISGLNQLFQQTATVTQLNGKANVDGSNINVSAYQEKLNITNLIATAKEEVKTELLNGAPEAFDTLKEISDWISDDETAEGAILQAIQTEAAARINADNLKLNKPTTTSTTASYPYVVGEDGNGNPARLPAGDLGKNFFNSDLSNTTARNHTMNAGITVNTLGNPHTLSGLPNKNTDIANFRKVRVQNASGLDSVVDSKNLLTDGVTSMTEVEKNSFATIVNGGYSTSTMSIAAIIPLTIEIIDSVQYITVIGNNLNVNPLNFSVLILDENNNTVADVSANSNISSPTQLIFWYNFKNFTAGKYKIKINNGVSSITSTTTFDVVTLLTKTEINTSTLIWKSNEYTGATASGNGGNAAMTINHGGSITILKSNPIINTSVGNFVLSMVGTCTFASSWNDGLNVLSGLGVIFNGGTTIPVTETASKGILITEKFMGNIAYTSIGLQTTANTSNNYTLSFEFIIQKINNVVIYLLIVNNTKVYSSYTSISTDFDISAIIKGYPMSVGGGNTSYTISGISGYTY